MYIQTNAYRGKGGGRGGSRGGGRGRGGSRGGRGRSYGGGRHHSGKGMNQSRGRSYGRAPSSYRSRSGVKHFGKNTYTRTLTGHTGRPGQAGHYSWRATYGPGGRLQSLSRGYGMAKGSRGTYGQPGTNRGSFRISLRNGNTPGARGGGRRFGGVSNISAPAVSPAPGGGGGGDDGGGTTPTPTPGGTERSVRVRNSPARRTALRRGRRGDASRRSARTQLGGLSAGGSSRSGINV